MASADHKEDEEYIIADHNDTCIIIQEFYGILRVQSVV